jgi:hypothetical protein
VRRGPAGRGRPGSPGGQRPKLAEERRAGRAVGHRLGGQRQHIALQRVHGRIEMQPGIDQRSGVERLHHAADLRQLQQPGPLGNEQPDRVLHRRHVLRQAQLVDLGQELQVPRQSGPWSEGDERGAEPDAQVPQRLHGSDEVGPGVPLVEDFQDVLVHRLDRAGQQDAPGVGQDGQPVSMADQVLDLDDDVIGQGGELIVQSLHDGSGVRGAVEEVWVAEADVLGAGRDLLADVGQHDVALHDPELAAVDRHDRAVPAQMLAAAGGLGVADRAAGTIGQR